MADDLMKMPPPGLSRWLVGFRTTGALLVLRSAQANEPPGQARWGIQQAVDDAPAAAQSPINDSLLRRWWAIAGLALFGATWRLWTSQTEFPQVPFFVWAGSLPSFLDRSVFGILLASLAFAAWKPDSRRIWMTLTVTLSALIVLDQHRLQPWAWQLLLLAICWNSASNRLAGNLPHVALTISIYFWSAVSKLDAEFFVSHGPTLVEALFGAIGIDATAIPVRMKWWLATTLPLGELLVAVGLCWPRTRRAALIGATGLHVGLLLALGPLGLRHRPGVLLWNVAFIGHDWLLFGRRCKGSTSRGVDGTMRRWLSRMLRACEGISWGTFSTCQSSEGSSTLKTCSTASQVFRFALLAVACIWPVTERWGWCDRWLAWSVYAARSERVSVTLTDEGLRRLPESARRCVVEGELQLDQWSLAALDVPTYPQLRFQFGVVAWLRRTCGDENLVEVIVQRGISGVERMTVDQLSECSREF